MNRIAVSIVSHDHGAMLVGLLDDLNLQLDLKSMQVIITLNIAESFDPERYTNLRIKVIRNSVPMGFGANHNAAFAVSTAHWFVVLNPDVRLQESMVFDRLARHAAAIDRLGVIAPRILSSRGTTEDAVRSNLTPLSLIRRRLGKSGIVQPDAPSMLGRPFYWLAGMCMMFDSTAFRSVGGFDDRIFLYCEDYDLCARLYNAGYVIAVDANVSVIHDAQRDSHRSSRHLLWHLASLFRIWTSSAFWRVTLKARRP